MAMPSYPPWRILFKEYYPKNTTEKYAVLRSEYDTEGSCT